MAYELLNLLLVYFKLTLNLEVTLIMNVFSNICIFYNSIEIVTTKSPFTFWDTGWPNPHQGQATCIISFRKDLIAKSGSSTAHKKHPSIWCMTPFCKGRIIWSRWKIVGEFGSLLQISGRKNAGNFLDSASVSLFTANTTFVCNYFTKNEHCKLYDYI